ncbi:major capsid protein [Acinetobacter ursingii]|uniref:major capsid protein n=1 Tax=Acinetobacter ursingii TaxID=108980 RepID=UPI0021CD7F72|nr:major capsid protein [Acinetobacter ursingii]MCU4481226.1 major capsid protein [Acinetobacter ursingii]MCU4505555.1 major capsid protein [Acinetobacter ursingii]MCU4571079.1 major capsid protein [Acinetobacter ursingii]
MNLADLFTPTALTTAALTLPKPPTMLGDKKIFKIVPVKTTYAVIESINGKLVLVSNTDRNGDPDKKGNEKRKRRVFEIPHLPKSTTILPDELNVQAFGGTGDQTAEQAKVINDKLQGLKNDIETTKEFHRVGAISGIVLDADGSVILNYFNEFGVTQKNINIQFSVDTTDIRKQVLDGKRHAQKKLGGAIVREWVAYCSATYFDALTAHPNVQKAYANYQEAQERLGGDNRSGFKYADVTWIEYEVEVSQPGGELIKFVPDNKARLVPLVDDLFQSIVGPANYNEAVNTLGQEMYAKAEERKMGKGWELEAQSNVLSVCTAPDALVTFTAT